MTYSQTSSTFCLLHTLALSCGGEDGEVLGRGRRVLQGILLLRSRNGSRTDLMAIPLMTRKISHPKLYKGDAVVTWQVESLLSVAFGERKHYAGSIVSVNCQAMGEVCFFSMKAPNRIVFSIQFIVISPCGISD